MSLSFLEEIGFTKGEIAVYEALLKLGTTTIGLISKKSGITAAKTYPILNKLEKKGLVSVTIIAKTKHFTPADPSRLLTYIEENKQKLDRFKTKIKEKLEELRIMLKNSVPDARVFKGIEGLNTFYQEHIRRIKEEKQPFRAFTLIEDWKKPEVKRFFRKYDLIRKEMRIEVRIIAPLETKKFIGKQEKELVKMRFLKQKIPLGMITSPFQVGILSWKEEPLLIAIDSEDIGKAYTDFFDNMWIRAKP